jgi:hypothetical protein
VAPRVAFHIHRSHHQATLLRVTAV